MGFRRPFEFAFALWPLFSDDLLSLVGSYVTPLCRHSRAGGNPVLSAQKLIGQKGFLNSASWIPAVACPRVGGGGNDGSSKQRIGLS